MAQKKEGVKKEKSLEVKLEKALQLHVTTIADMGDQENDCHSQSGH